MLVRFLKVSTALALAALTLAFFAAAPAQAYDSQTNREASVTVKVKPTVLQPSQPIAFEVSLNTHSVELGQDLAKVSSLSDNLGNQYTPSAWNGSPPGGHHRSGTLLFPALNAKASQVTLVIRNVGKAPQRSFTWKVEK